MAELDFSIIRELGQALSTPEKPKSQTKKAIVREVTPDGVVVEVGGSGVLTPVESSVATYSVGDVVQVTNRGGRLTIGGNATAPSVGAQFVNNIIAPVAEAVKAAATVAAQGVKDSAAAQKIADEAQALASALNQHFWTDTSGIHVTESTQEDWEDEPTGHNILINSLGMLLRNALLNSVSITDSATAFFDGLGNAAGNIVARFGRDGAQIGKSGESHMDLDSTSVRSVNEDGYCFFAIDNDLGYTGATISSNLIIESPQKGVSYDYDLAQAFDVLPDSGTAVRIKLSATCSGVAADGRCSFYYGTDASGTATVYGDDTPSAYVSWAYDADADKVSLSWTATDSGYSFNWYGYASYVTDTKATAVTIGTSTSQAGQSLTVGEGLSANRNQAAFGKWNAADTDDRYAIAVGNGYDNVNKKTTYGVRRNGLVDKEVEYLSRELYTNTVHSIGSTWTYTDVKLDSDAGSSQLTPSLIDSGYGIKVLEKGTYMVSASFVVRNPCYVAIFTDDYRQATYPQPDTSWRGGSLGPITVQLGANSIVKLRICKTTTTNPEVAGGDGSAVMTRLDITRLG